MRLLLLYIFSVYLLFGDVFEPNGTHCDDYSYLNSKVQNLDYVATAMKANSHIVINEISMGAIQTIDYDGNSSNDARFKIELVKKGVGYEPTGEPIAFLGYASSISSSKLFANLDITIASGTVFYLKYTPLAPKLGTNLYMFTAKECWCDASNCNQNGDLQLGSHLDGQKSARVSQVWRTNSESDQLGVYTNAHFENLKISYSKVTSIDPCNAKISGKSDIDGDNVSDICDLDIDNDGIFNANEGHCVVNRSGNNRIVYVLDTSGSVDSKEYAAWADSINRLSSSLLEKDPNVEIAIVQYGTPYYRKPQETKVAVSRPFLNEHPHWTVDKRDTSLGTDDNLASSFFKMREYWKEGGEVDLTQNTDNHIIIFTDAWDKSRVGSVMRNISVNGGPEYNPEALPEFGEFDFVKNTYNAQIIMVHAEPYVSGAKTAARTISSKDTSGNSLALFGTFTITDNQIATIVNNTVSPSEDNDNDGVANCFDLDSDNDGITDNIEAQSTQGYIKPSHIVDAYGIDNAYKNGITPVDTDGDTIKDFLDVDSDNDEIFDIEESGLGNNDSDNDGRTNAPVGFNGLDDASTIERADNFLDVNGMAYDGRKFLLKDSDDDTKEDGSNAAPMGIDLDYRDNDDAISNRPLKIGSFNVERIHSNSIDNATQERKEALYTQITGRDFNYAVVSYSQENANEEEAISDVTVKVELVDMNRSKAVLYTDYLYFDKNSTQSRVVNIKPNDLNLSSAYKNLRFKISYLVDENGSVIKGEYAQKNAYAYGETLYKEKSDYSRDNFSVRAEYFKVEIYDGDSLRANNSVLNSIPFRFASGYDYSLRVKATQFNSTLRSQNYNASVNSILEFKNIDLNCNDESNSSRIRVFDNGQVDDELFEHNNTGTYVFYMNDEDWTEVDANKAQPDCIVNSSTTSKSSDAMSGCSISSMNDINMAFYPDHFNVDLTMQNLPNTTHPDFIYMMKLDATNNNVAIDFSGTITAQNANNNATSNFTKGCVANNVLLDLNATTVSLEGTDQEILTTLGTAVKFSRVIRFNDENSSKNVEVNNSLSNLKSSFSIASDRFLKDRNGSLSLDIRYNLNKNTKEPINPVEVTFHSIKVSSNNAYSTAYDSVHYVPSGVHGFNRVRNFYFARVVSSLDKYPRVNINVEPLVKTPLHVDFFCDRKVPKYCEARKVLDHTNPLSTNRDQEGWYISTDHNGAVDGNVTALIDNPNQLTIKPNPTPSGALDLMLDGGTNNKVTALFKNCNTSTVTVQITTSPVLAFEPSEYVLQCSDAQPSEWTGVGKTGHVLGVNSNATRSRKMNW